VTGDNSTTWTAWFMTSPGAVEVAADVRGQPPLFTIAYSPKTPQKRAGKKRYRRKYLKSLALPRGLEPLFSP
jgi:hypothetical protein